MFKKTFGPLPRFPGNNLLLCILAFHYQKKCRKGWSSVKSANDVLCNFGSDMDNKRAKFYNDLDNDNE